MDIVDPFDQPTAKRGIVDPFDAPESPLLKGANANLPWQETPDKDAINRLKITGDVGATLATRLTPAGMLPMVAGGAAGIGSAIGDTAHNSLGDFFNALVPESARPFAPPGAASFLADASDKRDVLGNAADTIENVEKGFSYQPQTQAGKVAAAVPDYVFNKIGQGADYLGQKTTDVTGSPLAGAGVSTAAQLLPLLLGERAVRGGIGTAKAVRAADLSRGDPNIMANIDADMAGPSGTAIDTTPNAAGFNKNSDALTLSDMLTKSATDTPAPTPADGLKTMLDQVKTTIAQGLAPKPNESEAAPVQPPPPAVAAGLKAVTGGDPQKMAAVIQGAVGDKLKPGETPENLAAAVQSAKEPPNAASGPVAVQPDNRGAGTGVDSAPVPQEAAASPAVVPVSESPNPPPPRVTPGVDKTTDVPLAAGVVKASPRAPEHVAIDKDVPQWVKVPEHVNEKGEVFPESWVDQHEEIDGHEKAEEPNIAALGYQKAHDIHGNAATDDFARRNGMDPKVYRKAQADTVEAARTKAEKGNATNIDPALDSRPYTDAGDEHLLTQEPVEQNVPQTAKPISESEKPNSVSTPALDTQRLSELRQARDAGTATPEQMHELSSLQDTAAHTADVNGELIPGVLNARGRTALEASGQMKPVRVKTDLDDFKDINDTLGHDVGDQALKLKAEAMRDAFGAGNVWREGGDEFGAHADTEEAAHAAMQQVRDKLAGARLERVDDDGNVLGSKPMKVSYGVGRGKTPKEAAKAADNALYADKNARTAAGERTGRRSTDAGTDAARVGAGNESAPSKGQVPPGGSEEVAVAEPPTQTAPSNPPPTKTVEAAAETNPAKQEGTQVRNAAVDAQRDELGLDELPPAEREHWQDASDEARAGIASGDIHPRTLAAEVAAKPRALTTVETMALAHDLKSLSEQRASAVSDALDARERGDTVAEAQALLRKNAALDAMETNHAALRNGGTEAARSLAIRNAILKDDYTIGRNMDRAKLAYGDKFNDALRKQVETLSDELEKAQAEAARLQKAAESRRSTSKVKMTEEEKTQARLQAQIDKLQKTIEERTRLCPI